VPFDGLLEAAPAGARHGGNAPLAMAAVKRLARRRELARFGAGAGQQAFGLLRDTEDRLEGREAFAERKPLFWTMSTSHE
jgi:E-phenylitaconyl-CoA hydratase